MADPLKSLLGLLDKQNKSLIIEKSLSTSINSLVPFSKLKDLTNINNVHWFDDQLTSISQLTNNFTFLIRSNLTNLPIFQSRVKELLLTNPAARIDVILTSDYFKAFKHELTKIGVYGDLNSIHPWDLFIVDLKAQTYQLYLQNELNSLYLYKTPNIPYKLANWLNNYLIENPELRITHILSKGLNSAKFVSILKNLRNNYISSLTPLQKKQQLKIDNGLYGSSSNNSGKQTDLIVLERNLDFLSVLLNQLSYSGIIDEVYDIDINTIKIENQTTYLDMIDEGTDSLYDSIRSMNFGIACDYLNTEAKNLQSQYDEIQQSQTISQVKNFVDQLSNLESLKKQVSNHTKISEDILLNLKTGDEDSEFNNILDFQQDILLQNLSYSNTILKITELIYENYTIYDILRLICITSIVNNGLRERDYVNLNNEIIESYGFKYFQLLQNLIKIGLITIRGDPSIIKNFSSLNAKLNLIPDPEEEEQQNNFHNPLEPKTPNFAYRGYVPLVTRILQHCLNPEKRTTWKNLDLGSLILGKTIDEELTEDNIGLGGSLQKNSTVFIVMIGGLTYSELATIKFVEKEFKRKYNIEKKFIIVTDSFINAKDLLDSNL